MFPNGLTGFFVVSITGVVRGLGGTSAGPDHVPMTMGTEPLTFLSDGFGNAIYIEYTP
jgi:hypothetical protein